MQTKYEGAASFNLLLCELLSDKTCGMYNTTLKNLRRQIFFVVRLVNYDAFFDPKSHILQKLKRIDSFKFKL